MVGGHPIGSSLGTSVIHNHDLRRLLLNPKRQHLFEMMETSFADTNEADSRHSGFRVVFFNEGTEFMFSK